MPWQSMNRRSDRPVRLPNLPESQVTLAVVSGKERALAEGLRRFGVRTLSTLPAAALGEGSVATHPDMLLCHLEGKDILLDPSQRFLIPVLEKHMFEVQISSAKLCGKYPNDCRLNCARVGDRVFYGPSAAPELLAFWERTGKTMYPVRQGYCKCGLCIVSEEAVITADPGLAAAAGHAGLAVLTIRPGYIRLPGYDYGFLGGASGKLAPDILGFYGEIAGHPDYENIRAFASEHGVSLLSLCGGDLRDCGGILPLCETASSQHPAARDTLCAHESPQNGRPPARRACRAASSGQ